MLSNEKYRKKVGIPSSHENYTRYLEILESYGENRWWLYKKGEAAFPPSA